MSPHPPASEVPVLIVGAGPAGLASAITLARQGVDLLLLERRRELSSLPRATALSTRSMELLRSWGLEAAVRAAALEVDWLIWECRTLAEAADGVGFATGLPTRAQASVISPVAPECVPQDHLEPVMLDLLRSLRPGSVALGTEVTGIVEAPDGIHVDVWDAAAGASRTVRARYVVAADGAHSTLRRSLGIAMRGPDGLAHVVTALFRAPLWDLLPEERYGLYSVIHPESNSTLLPAGRGDRWLFGIERDPTRNEVADYTHERLRELIRTAAGVADIEPRIERTGSFTFAAQIADRFRSGDVFLVGDAAHRVTPRGGTGMNTALQDGHDLGWKLAWVLRGWAPPALLDSYEAERRPVAEHNVARSAEVDGSRRPVAQEVHADLGGRIPHVRVGRAGDEVSSLDLLGPGLTLFTGPDPSARQPGVAAPEGSPPLVIRSLDALSARAMGLRSGGALLARPDGVPVASWAHSSDAGTSLRAAIAAAVTGDAKAAPRRDAA